jgi:hypothetical protein
MTRIVWNDAALQRMFRDPNGPIGRDLKRRAINVESAAKLNASGRAVAGANNPEGRGPNVDTGRLRSSITYQIEERASGLVAKIGTNVEYGRPLETGLRGGRTYPFLAPALPAARL